jgi:hypothetical protein
MRPTTRLTIAAVLLTTAYLNTSCDNERGVSTPISTVEALNPNQLNHNVTATNVTTSCRTDINGEEASNYEIGIQIENRSGHENIRINQQILEELLNTSYEFIQTQYNITPNLPSKIQIRLVDSLNGLAAQTTTEDEQNYLVEIAISDILKARNQGELSADTAAIFLDEFINILLMNRGLEITATQSQKTTEESISWGARLAVEAQARSISYAEYVNRVTNIGPVEYYGDGVRPIILPEGQYANFATIAERGQYLLYYIN